MNELELSPRIVNKHEIGKWIACLNYHVKMLRKQSIALEESDEQRQLQILTQELYTLKESVIIKLLNEGHMHVRQHQKGGGKEFYTIRLNKHHTFHLPRTKRLKEAIRAYENHQAILQTEGCVAEQICGLPTA